MPIPIGLESLIKTNNGTIIAKQANSIGISNERLRLLVQSGELERISHGVYTLPSHTIDRLYVTQMRRSKAIYSHETALYLNGLIEDEPKEYTVTVYTGYSPARLRKTNLKVFFIAEDLADFGFIQVATKYGNMVNTYNMERTICDCLRNRNQLDHFVVNEGIKAYLRRKDKNINVLLDMAEVFRVSKPLKNYLDVLL
jgi:predicted transcriptional regulator of viral defense system